VLLACLLGIVLITGEYHHQTATTTFTLTPRRTTVVRGKLVTAVGLAGASWLASTVVSVVAGAVFLHTQGYGTQLDHWDVDRAILLNLAAYAIWAVGPARRWCRQPGVEPRPRSTLSAGTAYCGTSRR